MAHDEGAAVPTVPGFWSWLFRRDADGYRGLSNVLNWWLLFHLTLGGALAIVLRVNATELAKAIALPGAAILVGLAFGWAGRSASLLQDKSFSKFLIENGPSPEGYVYSFQLAVLSVLIFIVIALVIVAGGVGVDLGSATVNGFADRALLFTSGSIATRESWGIIYFVNKLTIQYYRVREEELRDEE